MRLSLFFFAASAAVGSAEDGYELLLQGAAKADEGGLDAAWVPERHFGVFGGPYPNPSVLAAAIAARTTRLGIRAGSVVPALHHPVRIVEEWAAVDVLSGGRVGVSFASGWHPRDFLLAPSTAYERRRDDFAVNVQTIRQIWRDGRFAAPADELVPVWPRPVQSELPVWITASGTPATFALAGKLGANVLTHLIRQDTASVAKSIAGYRAARERADGSRGWVTLMLHTYVHHDATTARAIAAPALRDYLRESLSLTQSAAQVYERDTGDPASARLAATLDRASGRDVETLLDYSAARYIHNGLIGSPAECRDRLDRLAGADIDEVACLVDFGVPISEALEGIDQIVELQ